MADTWDDYAEGWDSNEDVRSYSEKAFKSLLTTIEIEGLRILDFGCGTGLLTEKMAPLSNHIVALDNSEKMAAIHKSKNINNVDVLAVNLNQDAIDANAHFHDKFDLIVASSVCAFLQDYKATLRLLKTLLKPNGLFIQWDWMKSDKDPNFGFKQDDIESAFRNTGLEIVSITEAFSLESEQGSMKVLMGIGKNA